MEQQTTLTDSNNTQYCFKWKKRWKCQWHIRTCCKEDNYYSRQSPWRSL